MPRRLLRDDQDRHGKQHIKLHIWLQAFYLLANTGMSVHISTAVLAPPTNPRGSSPCVSKRPCKPVALPRWSAKAKLSKRTKPISATRRKANGTPQQGVAAFTAHQSETLRLHRIIQLLSAAEAARFQDRLIRGPVSLLLAQSRLVPALAHATERAKLAHPWIQPLVLEQKGNNSYLFGSVSTFFVAPRVDRAIVVLVRLYVPEHVAAWSGQS
jgi:hypothetical protein